MRTKLYSAIFFGLSVLVAQESGSSVDLFNNPVGAIGQVTKPDLFNNPVGQIGVADTKPAPVQTAAAQVAPPASQVAAAATTPTTVAAPKKSKHWAYQAIKSPAQPNVNNKAWVRTPIDAFVLAPLETKGLAPSPDADRAAFVRRATLDAWGVIPTPEDVAAFVSDTSPNAYEKLADRLLESPKYGERQARRWLDLARYADSSGFTNDETRENLWRYRDYVINAFNHDKPYNQFVSEQLAGDEIAPGNSEALIATGFLRSYPDDSNSRDLVQKKFQNTTDITDTVGEVFLAQTVGCARCHNHKFDNISMKEYYSLQSFFANVHAVDNIPAPKGALEKSYEAQLSKWEEARKEVLAKKLALLDPIRDAGRKYNYERFSLATQAALNKPKEQWTPEDRWVNHRYDSNAKEEDLVAFYTDNSDKSAKNYQPDYADKAKQIKALDKELKKFDKLKPVAGSATISAVTELGYKDAPATHVRFSGVFDRPLEEVQPGFIAAINDEKPEILQLEFSSGRRAALAKWIASANNPLTARVFVNRVWAQYFGRGIVETVSDFGKAGKKPSNPELLDYLADNFIKQGWSIKKLHKEILLSSVYRQSSDAREDLAKADPENKLLGVFPRQRLEAEEIRDSLLVASGKLEGNVGGPSVFPPVPSNLGAGDKWQVSKDPHDQNRRSLYIFTRRSVPYPLLQTFDMASAQQVHSKRDVTTTPLQALALFNSDTVFEWSQALAGRVISEAGDNETAQLDRLYQILFSRSPNDAEKAALQAFLGSQEKNILEKAATGKFAVSIPTGLKDTKAINPVRAAAFVDLVHTVANSNEFSYRF
ncbi:MAG: DUF1549 and DUF1553 domain-containing protein [Methylococcales bacterium]|nr:DUF1549 and DUF1553 domain-containing protein [Methylococcales bacterium]